MMEMLDESNKIKLEIKEEIKEEEDEINQEYKTICDSLVSPIKEDNEDQKYKTICDSLVASVKDEIKPTFVYESSQPFCSENSQVDYNKIEIKDCKVLIKPLCFNNVKNETKDFKEDAFLWCIKEGLFKTIKQDSFTKDGEDKTTDVKLKDTFQRNSSEIEEEYSDANTDQSHSVENDCQEPIISTPSTSKKKKKYIKELKHICRYCNKKFPQSDVLKYHIMIHTGERPYECDFCCKRFRNKRLLNLHLQTHTIKKYSCKVCSKRFPCNYNLQEHMLIHENKRGFKCTLCSSKFNKRDALYRHIINVHNKEKDVGKMATKHIFEINPKGSCAPKPIKELQCDHCKKTFTSRDGLIDHIKCMHLSRNTYNCKMCGVKSSNEYCSDHETFNVVSYTCAVCKANFKARKLFKQHIQNIHPTEKPYGCAMCNDSFKVNYNLTVHIKVHHNTNKVNCFVCDICSMGFYRESYLKRHYKIHTQSDRTFICDLCDIKCRSKTDIRRHLETHFGGGHKPYQCEFCGKSFSKPSKLERHHLTHNGKKPYKCQLCDKAYKDEGSLKYHQNTHDGKTFTCVNCGFISISEQSFKRHMRQMVCQKKVFACKLCEKRLKSETYFKKHMKRCHSEHE